MEKTTIYLDKDIKMHLLEMVADKSKRHGKRAAMSDVIRDALREYLEKYGRYLNDEDETVVNNEKTHVSGLPDQFPGQFPGQAGEGEGQ